MLKCFFLQIFQSSSSFLEKSVFNSSFVDTEMFCEVSYWKCLNIKHSLQWTTTRLQILLHRWWIPKWKRSWCRWRHEVFLFKTLFALAEVRHRSGWTVSAQMESFLETLIPTTLFAAHDGEYWTYSAAVFYSLLSFFFSFSSEQKRLVNVTPKVRSLCILWASFNWLDENDVKARQWWQKLRRCPSGCLKAVGEKVLPHYFSSLKRPQTLRTHSVLLKYHQIYHIW